MDRQLEDMKWRILDLERAVDVRNDTIRETRKQLSAAESLASEVQGLRRKVEDFERARAMSAIPVPGPTERDEGWHKAMLVAARIAQDGRAPNDVVQRLIEVADEWEGDFDETQPLPTPAAKPATAAKDCEACRATPYDCDSCVNQDQYCDDAKPSAQPADSLPAEKRAGIYRKFNVARTDGSSAPGGKHERCEYFVLDWQHDPYTGPAVRAYADACEHSYPTLAAELRDKATKRFGPADKPADGGEGVQKVRSRVGYIFKQFFDAGNTIGWNVMHENPRGEYIRVRVTEEPLDAGGKAGE